jgi:hypothetical protein
MVASSLLFCFAPLLNNLSFRTTCTRTDNVPRSSSLSVASIASPSSASDDLLPVIREAVVEAGGEDAWKDSTQLLSDLFGTEEEAELYLATAFCWKDWAKASDMMKRYQKPVLPDASKVQEALVWLKEGPLELNEDQVRSSIREYPKIYLVEPKESYRKVMSSAPRNYRDPSVLKELIKDDPNVLQVTYNCDGEGCSSECGSCWVSYANRLPSGPAF